MDTKALLGRQTQAKERPILFSAPMVRAILDGSKTQTRRVVKLPHMNPLGKWEPSVWGGENGGKTKDGRTMPEQGCIWHTRTGDILLSPYGQPGDRLWVRETWAKTNCLGSEFVVYAAGDNRTDYAGPWKPSIHMPRAASRITLEITGVRVERLQEISEEDAIAEGIGLTRSGIGISTTGNSPEPFAILMYRNLWEGINGPGSWEENPWVWVVKFRRQIA